MESGLIALFVILAAFLLLVALKLFMTWRARLYQSSSLLEGAIPLQVEALSSPPVQIVVVSAANAAGSKIPIPDSTAGKAKDKNKNDSKRSIWLKDNQRGRGSASTSWWPPLLKIDTTASSPATVTAHVSIPSTASSAISAATPSVYHGKKSGKLRTGAGVGTTAEEEVYAMFSSAPTSASSAASGTATPRVYSAASPFIENEDELRRAFFAPKQEQDLGEAWEILSDEEALTAVLEDGRNRRISSLLHGNSWLINDHSNMEQLIPWTDPGVITVPSTLRAKTPPVRPSVAPPSGLPESSPSQMGSTNNNRYSHQNSSKDSGNDNHKNEILQDSSAPLTVEGDTDSYPSRSGYRHVKTGGMMSDDRGQYTSLNKSKKGTKGSYFVKSHGYHSSVSSNASYGESISPGVEYPDDSYQSNIVHKDHVYTSNDTSNMNRNPKHFVDNDDVEIDAETRYRLQQHQEMLNDVVAKLSLSSPSSSSAPIATRNTDTGSAAVKETQRPNLFARFGGLVTASHRHDSADGSGPSTTSSSTTTPSSSSMTSTFATTSARSSAPASKRASVHIPLIPTLLQYSHQSQRQNIANESEHSNSIQVAESSADPPSYAEVIKTVL